MNFGNLVSHALLIVVGKRVTKICFRLGLCAHTLNISKGFPNSREQMSRSSPASNLLIEGSISRLSPRSVQRLQKYT